MSNILFTDLPEKLKPSALFAIIKYNDLNYKVNFIIQKELENSTRLFLRCIETHPFDRSVDYDPNIHSHLDNNLKEQITGMYQKNTTPGSTIYKLVEKEIIGVNEEGDDEINLIPHPNAGTEISFIKDVDDYYMKFISSHIDVKLYIDAIQNVNFRLPLLSLDQNNIICYFSPQYIYEYFDYENITNYKFNILFNQTNRPTDITMPSKNTLKYNNIKSKNLSEYNELKDLDVNFINNFDDPTFEVLPLNITVKNRYFYYIQDDNESRETQHNVILKIPNGIYNETNNTYDINYKDKLYTIDLSGFNVIIYNYKNNKIGPMEFSPSGGYFYKTLLASDVALNMEDLQQGRFTFAVKIQNNPLPVNFNTEYLSSTVPITVSYSVDDTNPSASTYIYPSKKGIFLITNEDLLNFDNQILFLDDKILADETFDESKSMLKKDTIVNMFISYVYNNQTYYFNVKNTSSNEFIGSTALYLNINDVFRYTTSYTDYTNKTRLRWVDLIIHINNQIIRKYRIDFLNVKIDIMRKYKYGKQLDLINVEDISRNFRVTEKDLNEYDYIITKFTSTVTEITDLSINYFFKIYINVKEQNDLGYSFEKNAIVIKQRKGRKYIYNTYYNVFYNKDLIINDIFSALDNNFKLNGDQKIFSEFYQFVNPSKIINKFDLNQEVLQYDTVGSTEFQTNMQQIIRDQTKNALLTGDENILASAKSMEQMYKQMIEFGFFTENTNLTVDFEAVKTIQSSDVKFLEGVTDGNGDTVAIISENELSIDNLSSQIIGTNDANKIQIEATNANGDIVTLEIIQTNNIKIIKLGNVIKKTRPFVKGSIVTDLYATHTITNYCIDLNQLPSYEIKNYNYNKKAIRVWSKFPFEANALSKEYINESPENQQDFIINLPVRADSNLYDILVYGDEYEALLQSGIEYIITITQNNKTFQFNLLFFLQDLTYSIPEKYYDNILGVNFETTLVINSSFYYLLSRYGNMEDLSLYLRDISGGIYDNVNNITFSTKNIDKINYIYTNDDYITVDGNNYVLKDIFNKYYYTRIKEFVISIRGLGYGGSGIAEIINLGTGAIPCVTKDSFILTPSGEKCIVDLQEGDLVKTSNGENVPIIKKLVRNVKVPKKMPYLIPKNFYQQNLPNRNTFISPLHAFKVNDNWKYPKHQDFKQMEWDNVTYYNLKLPEYHRHHFICNGITMESWYDKDPNVAKFKWAKRGENLKKIFL